MTSTLLRLALRSTRTKASLICPRYNLPPILRLYRIVISHLFFQANRLNCHVPTTSAISASSFAICAISAASFYLPRTFIDMLTSGGYVVIATPYNITFDHANCQSLIHLRFNDCLQTLYREGLPCGSPAGPLSGSEIQKLPIFGVGHRSEIGSNTFAH